MGRILREKADVRKFHPLVIDIKDTHPNMEVFQRQCQKRITYYKKSNHDIHLYKVDGTKEKIEKGRRKRNEKLVNELDITTCLISDD